MVRSVAEKPRMARDRLRSKLARLDAVLCQNTPSASHTSALQLEMQNTRLQREVANLRLQVDACA